MPTAPASPGPLTGLDALLASLPVAATPRGGVDSGFTGVTTGPEADQANAEQDRGLGPLLTLPPTEVFATIDELVRRQELIAQNHLAQDTHWSLFVGGYPFSWLKHDTTRDVWSTGLPYGVNAVQIQAVPNKVLDLVNKKSEAVTVDFPEPDPEPLDDSEEAEGACDIAQRFLAQDGGEQGTNDAVLFDERLKRALWSSSTYLECWVDPVAGGYVPLQIEAHPEAVDANNPLVGPDGQPTTDYVQRYVTAAGQFTDKASEAAPQWQPKLMASRWGREHIRCYPEDRPVSEAERVIILGYCTVREAKRRWPDTVGQMTDEQIQTLCDWTPTRYLVLLPPYQRARWKLTDGKPIGGKAGRSDGASDEQLLFYYHYFGKATPDYPKGADIVVSGAKGGTIIGADTLDADVEIMKNGSTVSETRCLEIPLVQIRPRQDLIGLDPTGRAWVELIAGAAENNAFMANRFSRVIDKILTHPFVSTADSPISAAAVAAARSSGEFLTVVSKDSIPTQLPVPVLPTAFFNMYDKADEAINSIASTERAAQGADTSKERSGKAIQLAVSQNNVGNTSILESFNGSVARWNRIKLEQAMRSFSTPQLLRYEGEDGTAQADEFKAMDFALVGKVTIKAGTGTGTPADQKVNYLANLKAAGFMSEDDAKDAARPAFSKTLGAPPNPHEQYVARCVQSWLDGPPEAPKPDPNVPPQLDAMGQPVPPQDWAAQYRAWMTAQQQFEAEQAKFTQDTQAFQQYTTLAATAQAGPPTGDLGPEAQTEKAGIDYQSAAIQLSALQMQNPMAGTPPVAPQAPQVPKPWTPFEPRPNDSVPAIATIWERRLSKLMSSNKYKAFGAEWQDVLDRAYSTARQNVAIASGAQGGQPQSAPQKPQSKPATQPQQPQTGQRPPGAAPSPIGAAA